MKTMQILFFSALYILGVHRSYAAKTNLNNSEPNIEYILSDLAVSIQNIKASYDLSQASIHKKLVALNKELDTISQESRQLKILIQQNRLRRTSERLAFDENTEISKVRYIKGLQIMRILYEKTLALDHHFSSISTLHEIHKISNPNYYPAFGNLKEILKSKQDKKSGFGLTNLLGKNVYTSIVHAFVSLFNNDNIPKKEKEIKLKEIQCILDFTLRMYNDLNIIYFETRFLQKNNETVMKSLQDLFVDYTKPIKYTTSLKTCRDSDDWDTIRQNLNSYLGKLDAIHGDESLQYKAHRMQVNLEFPIDQLLQFITQYNAFIDQSSKFYQKFGIMLDSYENEKQCTDKTPPEYKKLKENIHIAIEKFNTAYKPVEINGSKMKEVLYGLSEYD